MESYRTKFEKMVVERVTKEAGRDLLHVSFGEPPDSKSVAMLQGVLAGPASAAVLAFYEEMDGLQIIWNHTGNSSPVTEFTPLLFMNRNVAFDGVINFLPLQTMLDPEVWKETVWFENDPTKKTEFLGEESTEAEIRKKLWPCDFFSVSTSMALYGGGTGGSLLLLQDYHLDYRDSRLTPFENYIEFVLASDGLTQLRHKVFNDLNGYRKPQLTTEQLLEAL